MLNDARRNLNMTGNPPCVAATLALLACMVAAPASAAPPVGGCDIANVRGARELHETLSLRAVEAMRRSMNAGWDKDARLKALIAENAAFNLGVGDVGRPLGVGVSGAHAMTETMHADSYRFLGWDYMDGPVEPCRASKVTVEFVNSRQRRRSQIEFAFDNGLIVAAVGWEQSFETGPL